MRAVWKGPFVDNKVLHDIYSLYKMSNKKIYFKSYLVTWDKSYNNKD